MNKDGMDPVADGGLASLRRRLKRAGDLRVFFDRLAAGPLRWILESRGAEAVLLRVPERLAALGLDLVESVRIGGLVPRIGRPHEASFTAVGPVPQHPRYRGYWYDPSTHSLVGLVLGVDLIRHDRRLHVVEFNLNAGLRPQRRALYDSPLDPVVPGLVSAARDHGFNRLVPYALSWNEAYREEFERAGREFGVDVRPAGFIRKRGSHTRTMPALPERLEPETAYAVFLGRKASVDHYIHNKDCSSFWFPEALERTRSPNGLVRGIPTYDRLTVPPADPDSPWPNVIVKLADSDKALHVIAARLRDEAHGREVLGLSETDGVPKALRLSLPARLLARISGRGRVIYQPFIPHEVDRDGHTRKHRILLFASPLFNRYLSMHAEVSEDRLPEAVPEGIVRSDAPYVVNYSRGRVRFRRVEPALEEEAPSAAEEIGRAIHDALSRKFEIGPE
jgi:hypothetical protein